MSSNTEQESSDYVLQVDGRLGRIEREVPIGVRSGVGGRVVVQVEAQGGAVSHHIGQGRDGKQVEDYDNITVESRGDVQKGKQNKVNWKIYKCDCSIRVVDYFIRIF